jgi:peptidyl-prolyl cis-trans isomerase SurA
MFSRFLFAGFFGLALSCLVILPSPATAGSFLSDRIVAIVNGEVITQSDLDEAVFRNLSAVNPELPIGTSERVSGNDKRFILQSLIERNLQLQLARQKGIIVEPSEVDQAISEMMRRQGIPSLDLFEKNLPKGLSSEAYRQELKDEITLVKLVERETRSKVVIRDEEVLDYYNAHQEAYKRPSEIRLSMIFIPAPKEGSPEAMQAAREKALDILSKINGGADFTETARKESSGPEALHGGDVGYFKPGDLSFSLEKAVAALSVGEVSGVVASSTGWYILKLTDQKAAEVLPFSKVRQEIQRTLFQEKQEQIYRFWLNRLRTISYVEIKL